MSIKALYRYILALLILLFSGVNYFSYQILFNLAFLVLMIVSYLVNPFKLSNKFIIISIAFFAVFMLQSIFINWISPYYFIRYFAFVLLIPYLLLNILPSNYNDYLIKIVYYLTIFDLVIWSLVILAPPMDSILTNLVTSLRLDPFYEKPKSLILYTHELSTSMGIRRFAGFWHEPGAYAVLLGYVLCFNTLKNNSLSSKENLVFILGMLVTFSTTAYIALAVSYYLYFILFIRKRTLIKVILVPFIIILSVYSYTRFDFLEEKVGTQIEDQMSVDIEGTRTSGRFLGLRKSLNVMKTYPVFGRGLSSKTQAESTSAEHTGYGWPGYFARLGLPLSIFLSILFYNGLKIYADYYNADRKWVFIFISLMALLLFSQKHTSTFIFMMIFFTPLVYSKHKDTIVRQSL